MQRTVACALALLIAPCALAQLELEYDPDAQTLALTGNDTGDFNPLVTWQTGSFGGIPATVNLISGVHFTISPSSTIDTTMEISVWDNGVQLEMLGLASPTGYAFVGLGIERDASGLSAAQSAYLASNDGLAIGLLNGSGYAPVTLSVVPAPGAIALFAGAGLACSRRRRCRRA